MSVLAPTDEPPATVEADPVQIDDFAEFFRYHYPRLVRALGLAGAGGQAEDIAQEAFALTFGHWRRIRTGSNPPGYVFRVAFRLLRRRGLLTTSPFDDEVEPARAADADPAEQVVARVDLDRSLARMPPRRRACVVLCWLLDLPTAEAAETLGIAVGTVRKQLELARRQVMPAPEA